MCVCQVKRCRRFSAREIVRNDDSELLHFSPQMYFLLSEVGIVFICVPWMDVCRLQVRGL